MTAFRCPQCSRVGSFGKTPWVRCSCGYRCNSDCLEANWIESPQQYRVEDSIEFPCEYRGERLRDIDCACVGDSTVYRCNVHGECMIRKLKPAMGPDTTCNLCSTRIAPSSLAAIITFHWNPLSRKRLSDTYLEWSANIGHSFVCYELAYGSQEIPGSVLFQGTELNVLWQKERLINLAINQLSPEIKYVAWIDHDLIFENLNWLDIGCDMIRNGKKAIQLFSHIEYQKSDRTIGRRIAGAVATIKSRGDTRMSNPGGAWIACREWLDSIGGLYDRNIAGGGDASFFLAVSGDRSDFIARQTPKLREDSLEWSKTVGRVPIDCIHQTATHLWHGEHRNRQYVSRDDILRRYDFDPKRHIELDHNGVWKWSDSVPNGLPEDIRLYFDNRKDDG